jgi:hypothetical protein
MQLKALHLRQMPRSVITTNNIRRQERSIVTTVYRMGHLHIKERSMQKLLIASIAAVTLTLPQMASAQSSPPPQGPQNQQSMQSQVKSNLEHAGFTNVQVMPSSFLVRAKDKDGNPVMMVINPDSVTAVTEMSGGQRSSATHGNTTTGSATANDHLNLTATQRHELWQSLSKQAAKESAPAGFTAKVGEAVPSLIKLQSLHSNLSSQIPAVKSYAYALLQDELLIVDPSSKKIVDIITQ